MIQRKKVLLIMILLFSLYRAFGSESLLQKAKDYWSKQAFLLEYNPIFHCSMSVGGEVDLSIWEIFGFHWEMLYLNTAMFVPISYGFEIKEQKITGWKMCQEGMFYLFPMLHKARVYFKPNVAAVIQQPLTGVYVSFGWTMGYFDFYTADPGYANNFGAGLSFKLGFRAVFMNFLTLNFYFGVSGFFNSDVDVFNTETGDYILAVNNGFYEYTAKAYPHVGVNIGFMLPLRYLIDYSPLEDD
jgi:hypothetical protein